jgi:hypothetical protein
VSEFYDPFAHPAVTPEQSAYARSRVDALMQSLRNVDADSYFQENLDWLRDDLVKVYEQAILDDTWSQLEWDISSRLEWVVGQLGTPRRSSEFAQVLARTSYGDVWDWVNRWDGHAPRDVGEQPEAFSPLPSSSSAATDPAVADDQGGYDTGEII